MQVLHQMILFVSFAKVLSKHDFFFNFPGLFQFFKKRLEYWFSENAGKSATAFSLDIFAPYELN